ncbi:MAG: hypothetical protein ACFFDP_10795 [Promethearchaeota archaeon]
MIVLKYEGGTYVEADKSASGIRCELDKATKKVTIILPRGTSLIERRTALRQADTISRSGFLLSTGERVGIGYELAIDEKVSAVPERLLKSPRVSYSTVPKSEGTSGQIVEDEE